MTMTATMASAETEEARVKTYPWSGYWWPHSEGEMLGPLGKYDSAVGSKAADWERKNNPSGSNVPKWFGYCHAWAASSIMENEPVKTVQSGSQAFGIGDQKGLLAACHANDVANSFGDRFGDKRGSEDRTDLSPDHFWMLLKRHVREQGVPLIVDIEAGEEVWNYPVFAYKVDYSPIQTGSNRYRGVISVWMADDAVPKDFVGVKRLLQKYHFEVTMAGGSVVMGSGKWIGTSEKDHPDFAWFPFVTRPENPEVKYEWVTKLLKRIPVAPGSTSPNSPSPESTANRPTPDNSTANRPNAEQPRPTRDDAIAGTPTTDRINMPPNTETTGDEIATGDHRPIDTSGIAVETLPDALLLDPIDLVTLVASKTSDFGLDISVDRFDGGVYREGDLMSVAGKSEKDGFLYLIAIDTQGMPSLLYPQPGDDNRVQGGPLFGIPSARATYQFRLNQPFGDYRIKAIVCEKQLEFSGMRAVEQEPPMKKPASSPAVKTKKSDVAIDDQGFRWNPTRSEQVRTLISEYTEKGKLAKERVNHVDLATLLGEFAQDEVVFYVGKKLDGETPVKMKK
jgi:hypothetical protein